MVQNIYMIFSIYVIKCNIIAREKKPMNLKLKKDEIKSGITIFLPKTPYNLKMYFLGGDKRKNQNTPRKTGEPIMRQNFEEFFKDRN